LGVGVVVCGRGGREELKGRGKRQERGAQKLGRVKLKPRGGNGGKKEVPEEGANPPKR